MIAALANYNIQTVVIRFSFPYRIRIRWTALPARASSRRRRGRFEAVARQRSRPPAVRGDRPSCGPSSTSTSSTDVSVEDIAGRGAASFLRVFYRRRTTSSCTSHPAGRGTTATRRRSSPRCAEYSQQPTGVFHALPISRGKSIINSHWIQDMGEFYGMNIFLAETSATSGGLDSLLDPAGPLKRGARARGARLRRAAAPTSSPTAPRPPTRSSCRRWSSPTTSCWSTATVTSRTTTGWCWPARTWSTSTPTRSTEYSMYGAVPLREIKQQLLRLQPGRHARPGEDAAAHQLHLRRHRLRRRSG